jgi:hypothetical protein
MPGSMELLADRDPEEVRFSTLESSSAEQASPAAIGTGSREGYQAQPGM